MARDIGLKHTTRKRCGRSRRLAKWVPGGLQPLAVWVLNIMQPAAYLPLRAAAYLSAPLPCHLQVKSEVSYYTGKKEYVAEL